MSVSFLVGTYDSDFETRYSWRYSWCTQLRFFLHAWIMNIEYPREYCMRDTPEVPTVLYTSSERQLINACIIIDLIACYHLKDAFHRKNEIILLQQRCLKGACSIIKYKIWIQFSLFLNAETKKRKKEKNERNCETEKEASFRTANSWIFAHVKNKTAYKLTILEVGNRTVLQLLRCILMLIRYSLQNGSRGAAGSKCYKDTDPHL